MTQGENCETCVKTSCPAKKAMPDENDQAYKERQLLNQRLCRIQHKIIVLSGKGGVGKSSVAVNLAAALSIAGKKTGLMDIDVHGPSIPKLLNLNGSAIRVKDNVIYPVAYDTNLKIMSVGLLINDPDQAVIWRGPMKHGIIKQFIRDVDWGDLDYLVIDSPPGTGDEPLSIAQLIPNADGALIVTTPQEVAIDDVRRSIKFCEKVDLNILGIIENMSGFVCPHCHEVTEVFASGGGEKLAKETGVPFLGRIPLDPNMVISGDQGTPFVSRFKDSKTAEAFQKIVEPLLHLPVIS